ncbi:hypothetical protein HN865_04850 [Candidatus Woesearchaeota archaeon]|jgi:hypothetical protein|nr:hypothetical protein [Candidatus Woesearchaeota archaeon]MBT7238152.1 hypothetical protein [Candidatus Woesearchaeota archaeon]
MNNISRSLIVLIILIILFLGLAGISYTGNVVDSFGKNPLVAVEFNYEDDSFSKDIHKELIAGDYSLKNIDEGKYLVLRWNKEIIKLNVFMKGQSKFEIWSEDDILVASGNLNSDNYREYNFELSGDLSHGDYALFNYGPGEIKINSISGVEVSESELNRFLELIAEGFI